MFSLGLIFLGIISWRELPVQRLPDITFPAMFYSARLTEGDYSPEKTNDELTRAIEKMVASLPGVRDMYSSTGSGYFWGYANFERGTDMRFRVIELQDRINKLTAGRREKIQTRVVPYSTSESTGQLMELILSVPVGEEFRTAACADLIRRRIRSIDGIAQVDIAGEMRPNFMLETESDQLTAYGLDVRKLVDAINQGSQEKTWLGSLSEGRKSHDVHIESRIGTIEELLNLRLDDMGIFPLGTLVTPARQTEEAESIYRFNGKNAIRVNITKEKDRNTIRMANLVRVRILELKKELPAGFDLTVVSDEAAALEKLLHNIAKLAIMGALLSLFVLMVFVRNWRIAMVVVISIPVSILITFNAMYAAGLSINILSLLGLAAGVGILVDNSIVVVENVYRYHQRRRPPREAAWLGSREVVRAIVVSTATNLVVFIPLLYIDEMIALVMKEMALSLVFPMLASLLVAITLVPMLAAKVMEAGKWLRLKHDNAENPPQGEQKPSKDYRILSGISRLISFSGKLNPYRKTDDPPRNLLKEFVLYCAKGSLRHPIRLFFVILIIFLTTLITSGIKIVIQRHSRSQKTYSITLYGKPPLSSTLKDTDQFFLQKERQIAQEMKKSDVFKSFSSRFTKDGGEITLEISDKYQSLYMDEFILAYKNFRSGDKNSGFRFWPFPSASLAAKPEGISYYNYGGSHGMPESVLITGENIDAMQRGAEIVKDFLQKDANIGNVEISTPLGTPEVQFIPDLELFLVMKADLSTLQSFFQAREERGIRTSLTLSDLSRRVERQVTVRVVTEEEKRARGEKKPRQTLRELKRTMIPLQGGGIVPLERLGSFIITHNTPTIEKKNRQRNINVGFSFQQSFYRQGLEKKRQETLRDIQKRLNTLKLPGGISAQLSGSLEEAETGRLTLRKLLLLAVLAIFLVMAFFFDSLISPIVILATLPLACIGGIWGIIIFNTTLNEIAMLGTILLAGLAVNNGILLIEFTRQMENWHGFRRSRALLAAISYRLRPILMTSLTTILGLLPILFSTEAEMEARSLVSVLVGGMSVSMLLTLVVIPTFYNVLSIGIERLQILKARILRQQFLTRQSFSDGARPPIAKPADSALRRQSYGPAFAAAPAEQSASVTSEMHISIKNISKIYPVFKWKKLLRIIPSRTYPIGHRPPEGVNALKHVALEIEPGMFGLLGPNGAGKTTLMKILTGIIEPTYGVVEMLGCDLRFHRQDIRSYISYLPQNFGVYESLNIEQYLNFFAPYYGLHDLTKRRQRIDEVIEMVGLSDAREKPMKRFSGGMRQRAGVAQFMLNPRPLIIVDEPTAGLDPVERVKFRLFLSELAQTRIVLLSTHIVDDITSSCKCVAVLNRGEVLYQGDVQGIQAQAQNLIWDIILPADQPPPIPRRQILFRKYTTGFLSRSAEGATRNVLCHYVSENPLPGSTPVQPSFEDAYVALLLKHDASTGNSSPLPNLHDNEQKTCITPPLSSIILGET